jgi:hypothetical protein
MLVLNAFQKKKFKKLKRKSEKAFYLKVLPLKAGISSGVAVPVLSSD